MIKNVETEEDFFKIIKTESVIVDFYADWCGPCKMLSPVLNEVDFIDVIKINVDVFPTLAKKFGIISIPTILFFKNGLEQEREIGYRGLEELKATYDSIK